MFSLTFTEHEESQQTQKSAGQHPSSDHRGNEENKGGEERGREKRSSGCRVKEVTERGIVVREKEGEGEGGEVVSSLTVRISL